MFKYLLSQMVQIQSITLTVLDLMQLKTQMLQIRRRERPVTVLNLHHIGRMQAIRLLRI